MHCPYEIEASNSNLFTNTEGRAPSTIPNHFTRKWQHVFVCSVMVARAMRSTASSSLTFALPAMVSSSKSSPTDTVRNILSDEGVLLMKHLNGGVKKGAFDEAAAKAKFEAWKQEKAAKSTAFAAAKAEAKKAAEAARLEAEKAVNAKKAEKVAEKKAAEAAAKAEAEAAAKAEAEAQEQPAEEANA